MGIDKLNDLVLWRDALGRHLVELVAQTLQLRFDDCIIDVFFAAKIGVKRTATFP